MSQKSNRSTVVSVRLDEIAVKAVDLLVNAGLAQSRSEAASQLISIGVQSSEELLRKARALEEHVRQLKHEMLDAVKSNDAHKVQRLLALDGQLKDASSEDGHTAVLLAAYYHAEEIKELLLQKGAALNLYEAASVGDSRRMRDMIGANPTLINSHSFDGYTPLGLASHFGHEEAAVLLLNAGADVHLKSKDGKLNNTPLHAAIAGNHINIATLLLAHGADANALCEGDWRPGYTPLHVAAHFNRPDMVKLLLEHGADPSIRNAQSATPAEHALARGHADLAELLQSAVPGPVGGE